jgi:hypothetical protein
MARTPALILLGGLAFSACADPETERLKQAVQPKYDKSTGRLAELAYDSNRNGRPDTWTDMDGARPLRSRIDSNEDGTIDRWEYYGDKGQLVRLGLARSAPGKPDAWAVLDPAGKVRHVEVSSTGDEQHIDRWEHYDPSQPGPDQAGALVGVDEDTNRDGQPDKWLTLSAGAIATAAFDENGDGVPDRRLTYRDGALVLIESDPDAAGRFASRAEVEAPAGRAGKDSGLPRR